MISRCYNKKDVSYSKYGAKGVTISNEWLCFDFFYRDIKLLDGWNEDDFLNHRIQLDKDKKLEGNKIYCKEFCQWLTNEENSRLGYEKQQLKIRAIKEDENIDIITTQREVSRNYNLTLTCVNKCLKGKQSQHKGWKFSYI